MRVKVPVVQTAHLFSFSITLLVQLIEMGSLAGFSTTVNLCWVYQLGWAKLSCSESLFGLGVDFCGRLVGRLPFGKTGYIYIYIYI